MEQNSLLEKIYAQGKENNEYLKKIDRRQRWSRNLNIIYWVIIIGSVFGLYSLSKPYVSEFFSQAQHNIELFAGMVNSK